MQSCLSPQFLHTLSSLKRLQDAPSRGDTPVQDAETDPEQLRLLHHVNVFSHLADVASLCRSHNRLKIANDQLSALIAGMPPVARQQHAEFSNSSVEGTEV